MTSVFLIAFVVGAGLLALWVDARVPSLAPDSLSTRMVAACVAAVLLVVVPVADGSAAAVRTSLLMVVLPALVLVFLTSVWLLRGLLDARLGS